MAHGNLQVNFGELLYKEVAVFGVHNSLDTGSQHLNAVLLQHTLLIKLGATVQRRLSAKGQQNAVGALFLDNLSYKIGRHRLEINLIGNALRSLDCGDVWVYKHRGDSFLAQGLQSLRPRIVKLTCLSDFQRTRTKYEHLLQLLFHISLIRVVYYQICFQRAKLQKMFLFKQQTWKKNAD